MIVAGFGFRTEAGLESLLDALHRTGGRPEALATAKDKAVAPAFRDLARRLGLRIVAISPQRLEAERTASRSSISLRHRRVGSVAEAAALAAAGPGAQLVGPRAISSDRMATCALAEGGRR